MRSTHSLSVGGCRVDVFVSTHFLCCRRSNRLTTVIARSELQRFGSKSLSRRVD